MDTPVIIIGLILLLIVVIPVYFVIRANKVNQNQIKSLFAQYSQNNRYRFQLIASQNRKALAIDPQNRGLLFIDFNLKEPYVAFRDLAETKGCAVATDNPQGLTNIVKKVEWIFFAKNGMSQSNDVLFHDRDKPYIVPVYGYEEQKLAEQWQELIHRYL
jgi:Tfp pilus assembly protein PilW